MKTANKRITVLTALIVGLVFSGAAYAQPAEGKGAQPYKKKAEEVLKKLNLSPQQEAQINVARESSRESAKKLFQELKNKRKELAVELDKQKSDPEKIKIFIADLKGLQGSLIEQRVDSIMRMKEILTPEQYRAFSDTMKKMRQENSGKKGWKNQD
jgi:Spy/CpxP family protein refolding chaperone